MIVNCKTAATLISRSMDTSLTLYEKLEIRIHLFLCRYVGGQDCSKYQAQIQFLHEAAKHMPKKARTGLSEAEKKKIQKTVREAAQAMQKGEK